LTPEARILLAATAGDADALRRCDPSGWNADRLIDLAARHQVSALAYQQLAATDGAGDIVPRGAMQEWRRAFAHHSMRNESLLNDLADIAGELAHRGIEFLVCKGPWVAFEAYPDPGARPIGDIDLCVREGDFRGSVEALAAVGYRSTGALPDGPEEALERAHYREQLRFGAPSRRPLELHFRMVNVGPPARDEAWVWAGRRRFDRGPASVDVPGPEAMLLHLALHANQHGFAILRLFHDLRFALERTRGELDAERFLAHVRALRCSRSVFFALQLAADLARAPRSAALLEALRPSAVRARLFRALWDVEGVRALQVRQPASEAEASRLYLLEMGSARDKLRYLVALVDAAGGLLPFLRGVRRAYE